MNSNFDQLEPIENHSNQRSFESMIRNVNTCRWECFPIDPDTNLWIYFRFLEVHGDTEKVWIFRKTCVELIMT